MKKLVILGSTGSIGKSTLSVVEHNPNPNQYEVFALVGGKNVELMLEQCRQYQPTFAAMDDEKSAQALKTALATLGSKTEVLAGQAAICELAAHFRSGYGNGCYCRSSRVITDTFCGESG